MARVPDLTVRVRVVGLGLVRILLALRAALPELLTAGAFIAGWSLITAGIVALTSPLAWLFSGGLLALSLGGWKLLWALATNGLYALTRPPKHDG
jgi:hypothetical protein